MTNKNILTYNSRVVKVEQDYFAPVAVLPINGLPIGTIYAFMSKVDPWLNENNPDQPTQDQRYIKNVFKNIFFVKLINSSDVSPVIQRIDWSSGTTYSYYQDTIDMFELDSNGFLVHDFYVRNRYDQVFKCLWNNNNQPSTIEPFFQPGTYGTNNIFQDADGYKWKYVFTVEARGKFKFMDTDWIPVGIGQNTPNPVQANPGTGLIAGCGAVEAINVLDGGYGFDEINSPITVNIVGDGVGATAKAHTNNGSITDITITNQGSGYSYANATIISNAGSGATLIAPVSPIGGHGFDPISELGCSHVMFAVDFKGNEGGKLPTDIDYRQVGLLVNPYDSTFTSANASSYSVSTKLTVASGVGTYINDETVFQGSTLDTATFKATVLSFDPASDIVQLINIVGTPTLNASLYGNISKNARTLLNVSPTDFMPFSGYLSYIENRSGVQRSFDGTETFKFILGY